MKRARKAPKIKPRTPWPKGLGARIARIQRTAPPVDMRPGELGRGLERSTRRRNGQ